MKTLAYFLNEVSLEIVGHKWFHHLKEIEVPDIQQIVDEACLRYTTQCCEVLRQQCYENAEIDYCSLPDMEPFIIESSILKTEIILP